MLTNDVVSFEQLALEHTQCHVLTRYCFFYRSFCFVVTKFIFKGHMLNYYLYHIMLPMLKIVLLLFRYVPAVVDHSEDMPCTGTYMLHQGIQRRLAITITHEQGPDFFWKDIKELVVGKWDAYRSLDF